MSADPYNRLGTFWSDGPCPECEPDNCSHTQKQRIRLRNAARDKAEQEYYDERDRQNGTGKYASNRNVIKCYGCGYRYSESIYYDHGCVVSDPRAQA